MSKKEEQKSTTRIAKGAFLALLVILVIAIAVVVAIAINVHFKSNKNNTFALTNNGTIYMEDAGGITVHSGEKFGVVIPKSEDLYQIEITANITEENDFDFMVGNEVHKWSDTAEKKFTGGFKITQTKSGFKIEYKSLSNIISSAYPGEKISVDEEMSEKEIFKLTVSSGKKSISLSFTLYRIVIEIGSGEIIS